MNRKVSVDQDSCISCGLCISTCPDVFRYSDSGKSEAYNSHGATGQAIQQAMDGCPVQCISWK